MHTADHALARAHRTGRNMLLAATAALLLGTVPALATPPTYGIAFLGDFGGTMTGQAINNSNHVVGYFRPTMGSSVYGWAFDGASSTTILPSPNKWMSYATDINDSNIVVGGTMAMPGNTSWATRWDTNTSTGASVSGVTVSPTAPLRINENGWIAGALNGVAAVYDGAIIHSLGTLGGTASTVTGLNNLNKIVGNSAVGGNQTTPHAFFFDTSMHDLGAFRAYDISDNGLIVGGVGGNGGFGVKVSGGSHAVVYDSSLHDLGTLSGFTASELRAVNATGQAVGNAANEKSGGHTYYAGMLYDGTALYDINTLISPTDFWYGKWHFNEAVDINDSGLILANGCYQPPSDLSQCTTKLSVVLYPIAH